MISLLKKIFFIYRKQYTILKDAINSLNGENSKQIVASSQLDKDIEQLEQKKKELETTKNEIIEKYNECQEDIYTLEKQCRDLYKKKELEKDKLHAQKTDRVKIDLAIRNIVKEVSILIIYIYISTLLT